MMENTATPIPDADMVRELDSKLFEYYRAYYRDDLGLPGWERRIESFRRNEEAQLKRAGRPTAFFDSLNLLTRSSLGRKLHRLGIPHRFVRERSYRANPPYPSSCKACCVAWTAITS